MIVLKISRSAPSRVTFQEHPHKCNIHILRSVHTSVTCIFSGSSTEVWHSYSKGVHTSVTFYIYRSAHISVTFVTVVLRQWRPCRITSIRTLGSDHRNVRNVTLLSQLAENLSDTFDTDTPSRNLINVRSVTTPVWSSVNSRGTWGG